MQNLVKNRAVLAVIACVLAGAAHMSAFSGGSAITYRVQNQWNIGGSGGWGYLLVDEPAHLLYIPRTDRVTVVDTKTGKVSGQISGLVDARAVALDARGRYGYVTDITDGTAGFVRAFDRETRKVIASIPTGINPEAAVFEPISRTVFAFATGNHTATLVDAISNRNAGTIKLTGRPSAATADGMGSVYVLLPASAELVRIDAQTRKVAAVLPLASCVGPTGLTFDRSRHALYSACENQLLISIDAGSGKVRQVGSIDAGPGNIVFDAKQDLLFTTASSGKLSIWRPDGLNEFVPVTAFDTEPGARTLAVDSREKRAYLVTAKFGPRTNETSEELQYRPTPVAGSFSVIVVGR